VDLATAQAELQPSKRRIARLLSSTPNTGLNKLGKEEAAIFDSASTEGQPETEFIEVQLKEPRRFISARAYALKARPRVFDVINVHSLRSYETNVLTNDITSLPLGTQASETSSVCQRTGNGLHPAPPSVEVLEPGRKCRQPNASSLLPHCGLERSPWRPTGMVYAQVEGFTCMFSQNALRGYKHKVCMRSNPSMLGLARVHVSVVSCLQQHFVS
jgi:hypothetical protein